MAEMPTQSQNFKRAFRKAVAIHGTFTLVLTVVLFVALYLVCFVLFPLPLVTDHWSSEIEAAVFFHVVTLITVAVLITISAFNLVAGVLNPPRGYSELIKKGVSTGRTPLLTVVLGVVMLWISTLIAILFRGADTTPTWFDIGGGWQKSYGGSGGMWFIGWLITFIFGAIGSSGLFRRYRDSVWRDVNTRMGVGSGDSER